MHCRLHISGVQQAVGALRQVNVWHGEWLRRLFVPLFQACSQMFGAYCILNPHRVRDGQSSPEHMLPVPRAVLLSQLSPQRHWSGFKQEAARRCLSVLHCFAQPCSL